MSELYRAKKPPIVYNSRPLDKIEVIARYNDTITFKSDWPVEEITVDAKWFYENFIK